VKNKIDFSSIKTVRVHKEQFDAIEKKADSIIITCIEDGRCVTFNSRIKYADDDRTSEITIVEIHNPERYKPFCKGYGILVKSMDETAVINMESNLSGLDINIPHGDYHVVPKYMWEVLDNEVVIPCCGGHIPTGLKIW